MKRILTCVLLALTLLMVCAPGYAATSKLDKYVLVANGETVALSTSTGYMFKNGGVLMIPVKAVCDALGVSCDVSSDKKSAVITRADGATAELRLNSKFVRVDGKKRVLKAATARQDGQLLTADVLLLKYLGVSYKHYQPAAARKSGYVSGVLVVANGTGSVALPVLPEVPTEDVLPDALKETAKTATQIVAVDFKGGSTATLALYEKKSGVWRKQYTTPAYVGSDGIDKTREGDKKTPTGAFNLTTPFGIKADPDARMGGYLKVTKYHYWSGQNGKYYNRLIDTRKLPGYTPAKADEHLIDYAPNYNYCLFIDYNKSGETGKGSAIFLHCIGKNKYTAGCVAVKESVMRSLVQTLDDGAKIVIY